MIIVEGPDGAGKTTLVNYIEQKLNIKRQPRTVSGETEILIPLGQHVEEALALGYGMRLYDRFALISSPMYIPVHNDPLVIRTFRGEMLDRYWLMKQYEKFKAVDPFIILCLPPMEVVLNNVRNDANNRVVAEYMETVYLNYHNWYCANQVINPSIFLWDYTDPNYEMLDLELLLIERRVKRLQ